MASTSRIGDAPAGEFRGDRPPAPRSPSTSSSISSAVSTATRAPRLGSSSRSPSVARILMASRSGVREMPKRSASSISLTRERGGRSPERISARRLDRPPRRAGSGDAGSSRPRSSSSLRSSDRQARLSLCRIYNTKFSWGGKGLVGRGRRRRPCKPGRHALQIPGPTNVPQAVLAAIARPTIDHRGPAFRDFGARSCPRRV